MTIWCHLFHGKYHEELMEHKRVEYRLDSFSYQTKTKLIWHRFIHCTKCHSPLLEPEKEFMTPEEMESQARMHMLDASLKRGIT